MNNSYYKPTWADRMANAPSCENLSLFCQPSSYTSCSAYWDDYAEAPDSFNLDLHVTDIFSTKLSDYQTSDDTPQEHDRLLDYLASDSEIKNHPNTTEFPLSKWNASCLSSYSHDTDDDAPYTDEQFCAENPSGNVLQLWIVNHGDQDTLDDKALFYGQIVRLSREGEKHALCLSEFLRRVSFTQAYISHEGIAESFAKPLLSKGNWPYIYTKDLIDRKDKDILGKFCEGFLTYVGQKHLLGIPESELWRSHEMPYSLVRNKEVGKTNSEDVRHCKKSYKKTKEKRSKQKDTSCVLEEGRYYRGKENQQSYNFFQNCQGSLSGNKPESPIPSVKFIPNRRRLQRLFSKTAVQYIPEDEPDPSGQNVQRLLVITNGEAIKKLLQAGLHRSFNNRIKPGAITIVTLRERALSQTQINRFSSFLGVAPGDAECFPPENILGGACTENSTTLNYLEVFNDASYIDSANPNT